MRILVVDDNLLAAGLLKTALESLGHEVAPPAPDYEAALAACRDYRPDMVFADLVMPGKDGLELLKALRGEFPSLRVAMVTAVDQAAVLARVEELGGAGVLRKPFSIAELRTFVESVARE